jgi:hypothetical protein
MLVADAAFDRLLLIVDELMRVMVWYSHLYLWYAQWFDGTDSPDGEADQAIVLCSMIGHAMQRMLQVKLRSHLLTVMQTQLAKAASVSHTSYTSVLLILIYMGQAASCHLPILPPGPGLVVGVGAQQRQKCNITSIKLLDVLFSI